MAKVQQEILDGFYEKLAESEAVSANTIKELRALLESDKQLKADDLVAILEKAAAEPEP